MKELFLKQLELFEDKGILLCYFSFKDKDNIKYRIYAKNINTDEIIDPKKIIVKQDGTKSSTYYLFNSLKEALEFIFQYV